MTSHGPTLFQRPDQLEETLYVVTSIFNAARYRSRWRLYEDFVHRMAAAGAVLYTVEVAFGNRAYAVTSQGNPCHLQLRTWDELWLKENALNLLVQHLPQDWQKVAWIDADVVFMRDDWANETMHALEHWPVVQLFSQTQDLTSQHELLGGMRSFADVWMKGGTSRLSGQYAYPHYDPTHQGFPGHPGYAWAMRREAWNLLGGLFDACILGAADWYMAHCFIGELHKALRTTTGVLASLLTEWQRRAMVCQWQGRALAGNLGCVEGLLLHHWHGPKGERRYQTREQILLTNDYEPDRDLKRDWQGLYQLTDRVPQLRRDLQHYFSERREDAPS